MADYTAIKNLITDVVKTNGEQEITGANLQNVLVSMINAVASSNNDDFDRINGRILNLLNYVDTENEDIRNEMQELANRLDTNRYGYNVTVFGLVAGVHTLATAVKNVPPSERFGGQKITFKTDAGWVTYQNTSLSIDNYEDVDNWVLDSGVNVEGDVTITNNPDYEDLTQNNQNELKFADKEYSAATFSGLGRVYLRKNIVSDKNVLTQAMLADANTIYIIQYDYDLNGSNITIPNNCVLKFEGGSLSNGTIIGSNTIIDAELVKIFSADILCGGSWKLYNIPISWFGAQADYNMSTDSGTDNSSAIIKSVYFSNIAKCPVFIPSAMNYYGISYSSSLDLSAFDYVDIKGASRESCVLRILNKDQHGIVYNNENGSLCLSDISVYGRWDIIKAQNLNSRPVASIARKIWYNNIKVKYSTAIAIGAKAVESKVTNCNVEFSVRDGINCTGSSYTLIDKCFVQHCGDDGIAVHNEVVSGTTTDNEGNVIRTVGNYLNYNSVTITNNRVEDSYGIKCNGAISLIISNNTVKYCQLYGISLGTFQQAFPQEANNNQIDILVANNIIESIMPSKMFGSTIEAYGITISSLMDTEAGMYNSNTGRFNPVRNIWFKNQSQNELNSDKKQYSDGYNCTILNNIILGSVTPVDYFSELGVGFHFTYTDYKDYDLRNYFSTNDGRVTKFGIMIAGNILDNTSIKNNIISSCSDALLRLNIKKGNIVIDSNHLVDCKKAMLDVYYYNTLQSAVTYITGNYIDLDKFHDSEYRNADGTYSLADSEPRLINQSGYTPNSLFLIERNIVKNLNRLVSNSNTKRIVRYNTIETEIKTVTSSQNAGVGATWFWEDGDVIYKHLDPSDTDYGKLYTDGLTKNITYGTGIPASGMGLTGQIIYNTPQNGVLTDGIIGWRRIRTSNTNILGTDWVALKVPSTT